jgi:hypothetical protein
MIKVGGREMLLTRAKAEAFRGSNWFFWIAGLSAVNAVILWFSANVMLLVGLGFLLFCHGFGTALGAQLGSTTLVPALTILMEALLVGFFALCGYLARRSWLSAIIVGSVAYALDAALLAYLGVWMAVALHALVLFFILRTFPIHAALARDKKATA